ncbi:pH-response regulator protein palH/RIM21 [Pseudocercospora fuligena]|uniref:pH-response regulator protein palH/RIM21 n=1 Tax=Pseudocercospora fuligena TaxID=685502 RepID=A0A8H6VT81_9PEZI|nr:pH-response regulator protein palH/RIM21 [Pseudocercospora fuligena]
MAHDVHPLAPRQLWNLPTQTTADVQAHCTPFTLPSNGVLSLADGAAITLTTDVIFQPECTGTRTGEIFAVGHLKDPFYASTIPMVYVISAATVIAWVLVIMLTITPRTSFFGAPGPPSFSNGHGIIGGANGGITGVTGTGSRPWLQKIAALAVAISLTIATADTLEVAERQYGVGYMDAMAMRKEVLGSLEIRITRVISDIFLWLAQVQTLIRLFPRHREKVLIKWIGFALIIFDTVFSCLNSFLINSAAKGRHFVDAIPALSYLFELALGLLYAAWVLYYAVTKRRYAFYHAKMRNIALIALLSIVSILTPVVFFITDVSNQDVAGWGDYFRWVGAAAASVVVWEWVERIEALERDDKKDGILGREIFDGDEMLDVLPEQGSEWTQSRNLRRNFRNPRGDGDDQGGAGNTSSMAENGFLGMAHRFRSRHQQSPQHYPLGRAHSNSQPNSQDRILPEGGEPLESTVLGGPTPPPMAADPVNRADTSSAGSTVYVVRYHPIADVPQPIRRRANTNRSERAQGRSAAQRRRTNHEPSEKDIIEAEEEPRPNHHRDHSIWNAVPNPFKRKRTSPPQEIQRAREAAGQRALTPAHNYSRWDLKNRLGALAAETGDRVRERGAARRAPVEDMPVTIVPAQPRGSNRTWSPAEQNQPSQRPAISNNLQNTPISGTTLATENQRFTPPQQAPQNSSEQAQGGATRQSTPTVTFQNRDGPPRADDISPVAGRGATIVVPAPPRRTPTSRNTPTPPVRSGGSRGADLSRPTPPPG